MDSNLKALEYLAMVGLVPEVIAVLETMGAWEGELPNGRHSGVRGDSEAFSNVGGRSDPSRGGLKVRHSRKMLMLAGLSHRSYFLVWLKLNPGNESGKSGGRYA